MHEELFSKEVLESWILKKTPIKFIKVNSITKIKVHPPTNFVKYRVSALASPHGKLRRAFSKKIPMNFDVFETDIRAHMRNGRNFTEAFYCAAVCTILGL
jgi:hypothetical protein